MTKTKTRAVSAVPPRAADAPGDPNRWRLKIVVQEDEELSAHRFTVWIAPDVDSGRHLCIGSGPTRAAAMADAEVELRGALGLLKGQECEDPPPCPKCGFVLSLTTP